MALPPSPPPPCTLNEYVEELRRDLHVFWKQLRTREQVEVGGCRAPLRYISLAYLCEYYGETRGRTKRAVEILATEVDPPIRIRQTHYNMFYIVPYNIELLGAEADRFSKEAAAEPMLQAAQALNRIEGLSVVQATIFKHILKYARQYGANFPEKVSSTGEVTVTASISYLATQLGHSNNGTRQAFKALARYGFLTVVEPGSQGKRNSLVVRLNIHRVPATLPPVVPAPTPSPK